jgi:hypothetical protein
LSASSTSKRRADMSQSTLKARAIAPTMRSGRSRSTGPLFDPGITVAALLRAAPTSNGTASPSGRSDDYRTNHPIVIGQIRK